jgi:two-component system phosphate regulon sensor histidine kinase PhoR
MRTLLEIVILAIMAIGVYQQANKATVPTHIDRHEIDKIDGRWILGSSDAVDAILDSKRIGDRVDIKYLSDYHWRDETVTLIPHYGPLMIWTVSVVSLIFLGIGSFVRRKRPNDQNAILFYGLTLSVGILISCSTGSMASLPYPMAILSRSCFFLAYGIAPVFLLHFSMNFALSDHMIRSSIMRALYVVAFILAVDHAVWDGMVRTEANWTFQWFDISYIVTHLWFAVVAVLSIGLALRGYRLSRNIGDRRRILWVLFGMGMSVASYLMLWSIPQMLFGRALLPEEFVVASSAIAPVAFAVAIIRYRALDIDVIVRVGVVHGLTIFAALLLYTVFVTIGFRFIRSDTLVFEYVIPLIIILNVLLFAPVRGLIQNLVDRWFFRVEYNYRNAVRESTQRIQQTISRMTLAAEVERQLVKFLHPSFVRVVVNDTDEESAIIIGDHSGEAVAIERDLRTNSGILLGSIQIGAKRSQINYTDEDADLVRNIATVAVQQLDKLHLARSLQTEHEKAEHEAAMNKLKSAFVSSVSHDLKTPLTSIQMYAELLEGKVVDERSKNYLRMIEGESARLGRLVDNVLDYAKIERGIMDYDRKVQNINPIVQRVLTVMEYPLGLHGFELHLEISSEPILANVDSDGLQNALTNLVSNAIKYSTSTKWLKIGTSVREGNAVIMVADQGIGIPENARQEIFTAFTRLKDPSAKGVAGAGLGLALVKHFVIGHGGSIELESEPGVGTTFTLLLPTA